MSHHEHDSGAGAELPRVDALRRRVRELSEGAARRSAARRRRQNVTSAVGIALAIGCALAMSALTRLSRTLDADAVAQIGRAELESHLPASRAALERYLESEAPRLVGESVHALIDVLPKVRRLVTDGLLAEFESLNGQFEAECHSWVAEEVLASKERINLDYPGMSDREQLEMLVADFSTSFVANFSIATDALYPRYREEMRRVQSELVRLQSTNPAFLDDEERAKKDIIETMLRLVLREHAGQG